MDKASPFIWTERAHDVEPQHKVGAAATYYDGSFIKPGEPAAMSFLGDGYIVRREPAHDIDDLNLIKHEDYAEVNGVILKRTVVEHPAHYNIGKIEVIDAIEDWQLNFSRGNAVKYIARAGHKNDELEDLRKARFYIDREIKRVEGLQK